MASGVNGAERASLFALVFYIPDPLAKFLDDLRTELVPRCTPRAHVTVLPPRPLADPTAALDRAREVAADFPTFDIRIGEVEVFAETEVIYLGIEEGNTGLCKMYRALNEGPLAFQEPFRYHPHVTLAQDLEPGQAGGLTELARRRWAEFSHSRRMLAERACFVQSISNGIWVDLAELSLRAARSR